MKNFKKIKLGVLSQLFQILLKTKEVFLREYFCVNETKVLSEKSLK